LNCWLDWLLFNKNQMNQTPPKETTSELLLRLAKAHIKKVSEQSQQSDRSKPKRDQ
jgi:hypothetical protein